MEYLLLLTMLGFVLLLMWHQTSSALRRWWETWRAPSCSTCFAKVPRPEWREQPIRCCPLHQTMLAIMTLSPALERIWMQRLDRSDPLQPPQPNLVPHCTRCGHLMPTLLIRLELDVSARRTTAPRSRDGRSGAGLASTAEPMQTSSPWDDSSLWKRPADRSS